MEELVSVGELYLKTGHFGKQSYRFGTALYGESVRVNRNTELSRICLHIEFGVFVWEK